MFTKPVMRAGRRDTEETASNNPEPKVPPRKRAKRSNSDADEAAENALACTQSDGEDSEEDPNAYHDDMMAFSRAQKGMLDVQARVAFVRDKWLDAKRELSQKRDVIDELMQHNKLLAMQVEALKESLKAAEERVAGTKKSEEQVEALTAALQAAEEKLDRIHGLSSAATP